MKTCDVCRGTSNLVSFIYGLKFYVCPACKGLGCLTK